jgi:hypothetical protein
MKNKKRHSSGCGAQLESDCKGWRLHPTGTLTGIQRIFYKGILNDI